MDDEYWFELLRSQFVGRKVIVKTDVIVAATPTVRTLRTLGVEAVLVVATSGPGTGELPSADEATLICLDPRVVGKGLGAAIRAGNAAIADLPPSALEAIDSFDPDGVAVAVGDFLNENTAIAGRPFLAHRRPDWIALDDKTTVDALWDRAGVSRSLCVAVAPEPSAVRAVFAQLDEGHGVVVAADSTPGWHGGAEGTRWARKGRAGRGRRATSTAR